MKIIRLGSWLTPLLVLSLVCSFALTATAQNHYPIEVGNTWTLDTADGTEQRRYTITGTEDYNGLEVYVLKIDTETLGTSVIVPDQYFITVDDTGLTLHQSLTDEGTFGFAEINYDPPTFFFPSSPTLGQQWQITGETELKLVGAASNTTSAEVVAIEDVVTPAGTFVDCAKIELSYKVTTALITLRPVEYIWLAPDVGPIKFANDQEIVYELASYDLVEPSAVEEAPAEEMPDTEEVPAVEEVPTAEEMPDPEEVPAVEETPSAEEAPAEMPMSQMFEITLTNLTMGEPGMGGQILSPPIFVTHAAGIDLAPVGEAANQAIVLLAENGDVSGLVALAAAAGANSTVADGVLPPGGSVTVTVTADMINSSLSVGSMLVSTNDAFIAATDVALFDEDGMPVSADIDLNAYDAGSEDNTEMASDIPGPLGLDPAVDPEGSNERVPTADGVITAHEGIQGVGDVGEAFAWEEPTAMLTITPVEAPAPPEPEPEPIVPGFDVTLEPGLNMVSVPLMPEEPYTARSLAEMLGATVIIQLDAASQSFLGYTVADSDDGFSIDGGKGYIVNTPTGGTVKFTGDAWDNQPEPEPTPEEPMVEEPMVEEPAAEEPMVEEPMVEEPVVEEPELKRWQKRWQRKWQKRTWKLTTEPLMMPLPLTPLMLHLPHLLSPPSEPHGRSSSQAIFKAWILERLTLSSLRISALAPSLPRTSQPV